MSSGPASGASWIAHARAKTTGTARRDARARGHEIHAKAARRAPRRGRLVVRGDRPLDGTSGESGSHATTTSATTSARVSAPATTAVRDSDQEAVAASRWSAATAAPASSEPAGWRSGRRSLGRRVAREGGCGATVVAPVRRRRRPAASSSSSSRSSSSRRGSRVVAEAAVVAARDRAPCRVLVRKREREHLVMPERSRHVLVPDRDGERRAGDRLAVHVEHRDLALRIAHPDDGRELPRVAVEPGVGVILGRPRLARVRMDAVARAGAGPVQRVLLQHVVDLPRDALRERALRLRLAPAGVRVDLVRPAGPPS